MKQAYVHNIMNLTEFINKYTGVGIDWDGHYGFQCVDLYRQYLWDVYGIKNAPLVVGAKDIWDKSPEGFERIPYQSGAYPQPGDIMIWNAKMGSGYGHVGVVHSGNADGFICFEQNPWKPKLVNRSYSNIIGWLHKPTTIMKKIVNQKGESVKITITSKGSLNGSVDYIDITHIAEGQLQCILGGQNYTRKISELPGDIVLVDVPDDLKKALESSEAKNAKLIKQLEVLKAENLNFQTQVEAGAKDRELILKELEAMSRTLDEIIENLVNTPTLSE